MHFLDENITVRKISNGYLLSWCEKTEEKENDVEFFTDDKEVLLQKLDTLLG